MIKANNLPASLNLPPMKQLGIIVQSIDTSLPYYTAMTNIRTWYRTNIVDETFYYKNKKIDLDLGIAIGYSGSLQFELIEVRHGEDNIYTDLIQTRGQGLHHIGFVVSNIDKKTDLLKKSGFECIQHGVLKTKGNAVTRFAYFDTMDEFGYILELIQTTLFGINVGLSKFMVRLGHLLGDVEIV